MGKNQRELSTHLINRLVVGLRCGLKQQTKLNQIKQESMINIDKYHINRIDELIEETERLRTRVNMYELKVGRLRRNICKLMNDDEQ